MPRGRPAKIIVDNSDLNEYEEATLTIAVVLQERCGITGCMPKFHLDEASIILRKLIRLDIIKERE